MIIEKFTRNGIFTYKNIIEVIATHIHDEFFIALNHIGFYDIEKEIYFPRKIAWCIALSIPVVLFIIVVFSACIKYLIS